MSQPPAKIPCTPSGNPTDFRGRDSSAGNPSGFESRTSGRAADALPDDSPLHQRGASHRLGDHSPIQGAGRSAGRPPDSDPRRESAGRRELGDDRDEAISSRPDSGRNESGAMPHPRSASAAQQQEAPASGEPRISADGCIKQCLECAAMCTRCGHHCLDMGAAHASPAHQGLMRDCAELCSLAAAMLARSSPLAPDICSLCARVCTSCAEDCDALCDGDALMSACADHCRDCARLCSAMAGPHTDTD